MKNEKEIPKPPIVHEIGGDYYYTCFWLKCGEDLKKWYNYCPKCGTKIDWGNEEDEIDK